MATDITIEVEPSGPYISSLASSVNEARNFRDAAQSALGAATATAADVLANKTATDAARLAAETASSAAAASASAALDAKAGAAAAALSAANVALIHDRYRNQLDDWRAAGVPDRPALFRRFADSTYYSRDKIVTSDFLSFLAATGGSFARASGGTTTDSAGNLIEFGSGAPRITDRGILVEAAATNLIRNPRGEGAVAPGTLPTYWSASNDSLLSSVTPGTLSGISGCYLRFAGVPGSTSAKAINFDSGVLGAIGDVFSTSIFCALTAGTLANVSTIALRAGDDASGATGLALTSTLTRFNCTQTLTQTKAGAVLRWNYLNTTDPVDFTVFVGAPQSVKTPYATSVILPPVGSPAQATRAAETITGTRAASLAFSKVIHARSARGVIVGSSQTLWHIDDGTSINRVYWTRYQDRTINLMILIAGNAVAVLNLGTVADDTDFKIALRATANNWAASLNGGAVVTSASAGMPPNLVTERIGNSIGGARWDGLIYFDAEFPTLLSNTQLQALTA